MAGAQKLRVLVVDDTIVYRKAVSDILEQLPGIEVVGVAHNGSIAMAKVKTLKPDLLTLDVEMPQMNGIEVLQELQKNHPDVGAIMLSTLTSEGSSLTLRALELGAFDFIPKPKGANVQANLAEIKALLAPMLPARPSVSSGRKAGPVIRKTASPATASCRRKSEIVTIGISTGGPNALHLMLPKLPKDLGVPVLIVQHMPPVFTKSLAESLDKKCALTVKEAEEGENILPNTIYIAPGGRQMKIIAGRDGIHRQIKLTDDPPENSCRPAADYLFRSVADYYVGRTTAVIMTGMGSDGTKGLGILKEKSAYIIGQDEQSCVVYGMPKTPAELGYLDTVLPLHKIADEIVRSVRSAI
ncbi:MAG: chemotaxis response regulator protein-glutamate methylesterase [Desulfobacterales bacterium]|nr:MAG: chemotaxis response regulator protein-glutamate methylesterase [Desulfobacterales bacterium]